MEQIKEFFKFEIEAYKETSTVRRVMFWVYVAFLVVGIAIGAISTILFAICFVLHQLECMTLEKRAEQVKEIVIEAASEIMAKREVELINEINQLKKENEELKSNSGSTPSAE